MNNENKKIKHSMIKTTMFTLLATYFFLNVAKGLRTGDYIYNNPFIKGHEITVTYYGHSKELIIRDPSKRNTWRPEYLLAVDEDGDDKFESIYISTEVGSALERIASKEKIDSLYQYILKDNANHNKHNQQ